MAARFRAEETLPGTREQIATVCVTLRATETSDSNMSKIAEIPNALVEILTSREFRRIPLVAPRMLHTRNDGAASTSTTSNALTTIVVTTVPASTHWARTASGFSSSLHRLKALKKRRMKALNNAAAGRNPRSETNATQSLLGHGFAVIPSSARERSLEGAKRTYSTGQLPGPTPNTGLEMAIRSEFWYCATRPRPLPLL